MNAIFCLINRIMGQNSPLNCSIQGIGIGKKGKNKCQLFKEKNLKEGGV